MITRLERRFLRWFLWYCDHKLLRLQAEIVDTQHHRDEALVILRTLEATDGTHTDGPRDT